MGYAIATGHALRAESILLPKSEGLSRYTNQQGSFAASETGQIIELDKVVTDRILPVLTTSFLRLTGLISILGWSG